MKQIWTYFKVKSYEPKVNIFSPLQVNILTVLISNLKGRMTKHKLDRTSRVQESLAHSNAWVLDLWNHKHEEAKVHTTELTLHTQPPAVFSQVFVTATWCVTGKLCEYKNYPDEATEFSLWHLACQEETCSSHVDTKFTNSPLKIRLASRNPQQRKPCCSWSRKTFAGSHQDPMWWSRHSYKYKHVEKRKKSQKRNKNTNANL